MDYEQFKNSIGIIDKSGIQAIFYFSNDSKFKPFEFFIKKDITLTFTEASLPEFTFQDYKNCNRTLFTGTEVVSVALGSKTAGQQEDNFVLSQTNATLTLRQLDPSGIPLIFTPLLPQFLTLWDTTAFMTNVNNVIDRQIIHSVRDEERNNKKVFVLTNDKGIIQQVKTESIKFLRSIDILKWMVKDKFISYQKGVAIFKKGKLNNWTHGLEFFKDI
jgi:hypothetical protein